MGNLQVRGLGSVGLLRDTEPWDDPWQAWSAGSNVRFENNKAVRAPVFRTMQDATGSSLADVVQPVGFRPDTGFDNIFLLDSSGRANLATSGLPLSDVSGTGFSPIAADTQFTSCVLGNVFYINRETHAPRYWLPTSTAFAPIPNQDVPFTCAVLRPLESCLVAFNVTKGSSNFGTMVKWSDATQYGGPPGSWDVTTPSTLAGENTITDASGPIMDAQTLRGAIVFYTYNQIYSMVPTGDATFVFAFNKIWQDDRWGVMGRNCAIEVNGLHYVFGNGDIYVHDGVSLPQSIAEGKVRRFVYSTMDMSQRQRFFVAHDPYLSAILFCYVSQDADVQFKAAGLCNKAAVWNYANNTWGSMELPNIGGGCNANSNTVRTWANDPTTNTWTTVGGSWADLSDGFKPALLLAGTAVPPQLPRGALYAIDPLFQDSRISLPVDPYANTPAYLEHGGVDLDLANIPLHYYKRVRKIIPQVQVFNGVPLNISIGAAEFTAALPNYEPPTAFNPASEYRIDSRASGRYLAFRIDAPSGCDFSATGFDLDVIGGGKK